MPYSFAKCKTTWNNRVSLNKPPGGDQSWLKKATSLNKERSRLLLLDILGLTFVDK